MAPSSRGGPRRLANGMPPDDEPVDPMTGIDPSSDFERQRLANAGDKPDEHPPWQPPIRPPRP